ncbi:MAG: hypothetical protein A3J09_01395 [Candidatus Zambryskibacteria bacterium RIFCSPLOWO2_02_FULL_51_21]|uniref:Uncharacterized protein n=1 Tax=Candidatus Zambryskibacteria bacterium RIFCSPHIGHO2_02_FULL_43_37 TaxID=1802749 RepID=A0A1G2TIT7_9BACT|nr:MAG: hypothetical protein A2723_01395 [Candidatus Zambryskibacteria bacterium RIFCSPHIGHO2_01_FULL_52_18]OHA96531.1 MAG: hypothetical protein A3D49_01505 [Candidatus Zambryskibacteria bacterium RIFCSPHIGHO2_02_FULL_43_37]OHB07199.1 MAG: hypothetical protein A2944_01275 [Candidatus Zambryskibacteria bacterium RIFCSPLOWO2_01_FULL_52_12]OHB11205.1 MAG: hypothetical protein A3J09_01395 [Candidatus Zambryskibacteria bacterium RIFCSPLOWO2_02_FULL_51_21]
MVLNDLKLGEMVVWDREVYPSILPDMIQRYGEGPFKVVGLRLWTSDIGKPSVAPYMVTVEVPNGTRQDLAGEWFERAWVTGL